MNPIKKVLKVSDEEYFIIHLHIINQLIPTKMTDREIHIVARAMRLDGELSNDRFGTTARKIIKRDLNLSDGGLGNFVKSLQSKGMLKTSPSGLEIHPILMPDNKEQTYLIKLINHE